MREYSITCFVIGLNSERTLRACLESLKQQGSSYIKGIIYVDEGSKDKSVAIAKTIGGIKVIELKLEKPTPGKGRNAGWKKAETEWVHFFDSDIVVDKNWILEAVKHIDSKTAAVFGLRKELYPRKNWFHFIADLEWTKPIPHTKFFGGDVLIKRSILEEVGGYDEGLIAGEDPELSARLRVKGWKIAGINTVMCYHDININTFTQYFKRSFRSGYAYAEAGIKMLKAAEKTWFLKSLKIFLKTGLIFLLIVFYVFTELQISLSVALIIAFFPLLKVYNFQKKFNITFKQALVYAVHCTVVLWPHFLGILKYYLNKVGNLTNSWMKIK